MQEFKLEMMNLENNTAAFAATSERYRVVLTVERIDGKPIAEMEARRVYTRAVAAFPQVISVGRVAD